MYGYITSVQTHKFFHRMPLLTSTDGGGIEEAFNTAKRLLGLSYLWTGSIICVKLKFGQLGCSTRF